MKIKILIFLALIILASTYQVSADNHEDGETPSNLLVAIMAVIFFTIITLQEIFEVFMGVLVWRELYLIKKEYSGRNK